MKIVLSPIDEDFRNAKEYADPRSCLLGTILKRVLPIGVRYQVSSGSLHLYSGFHPVVVKSIPSSVISYVEAAYYWLLFVSPRPHRPWFRKPFVWVFFLPDLNPEPKPKPDLELEPKEEAQS